MRYTRFIIENFRGIRKTEIEVSDSSPTKIHTLVGLNESGKTTILEAIHSFSPDVDTETVVGSEPRGSPVPRHAISDFTGDVNVTAQIAVTQDNLDELSTMAARHGLSLSIDKCSELSISRIQRYKNGDFVGNKYKFSLKFAVKSGRQRTWKEPTEEQRHTVYLVLRSILPRIIYFPTFMFNIPEKIYLTARDDDPVNDFYRQLFQDILDYDNRGHNITSHIIKRINKEEYKGIWSFFWPAFNSANEREKIDQIIDRAGITITNVIFSKWNKIFGEKAGKKEIVIGWGIDEGLPTKDANNNEKKAEKHDVFITFQIKDGANRYNVEDRSLGFRWFFSFLLFTQFRAARSNERATIFLFDEPASNLHAAAQQKLIESFPEIARDPHVLIYSTHSHYMINPIWLEGAYIVDNGTGSADKSIIESGLTGDENIDIRAIRYRRFVNENPTAVSYFQPVIDRLDVVPSKFDIGTGGVIVEGKTDFYVLNYFKRVNGKDELVLFPAVGATTMGALIALHRGWGLPVRVLLDGDSAGKRAATRYKREYLLSDDEIKCLDEICPDAKVIEELVVPSDWVKIANTYNGGAELTKINKARIFQEHSTSGRDLPLSVHSKKRARKVIEAIEKYSAD